MTIEQEKFEEARRLQHEFWDSLSALEEVLGVEIDGTRDLDDTTMDELIEVGATLNPTCAICDKPIEPDESSIEDGGEEVHSRCMENKEDGERGSGPRISDPDAMVDWVEENLTPPGAEETNDTEKV